MGRGRGGGGDLQQGEVTAMQKLTQQDIFH